MEENKNINPLVSVVILSYNRCADLRHTLSQVYVMSYKPFEVIVADNNSVDGTKEMLANEYPQVSVVHLSQNIGVAGWNEGAKRAKGEYLLFLDDDSFPERDSVKEALKDFCSLSTIVALNIRYPDGKPYSSMVFANNAPLTFIGCGVIIPRNLFERVGGFEPLLFLYQHEIEFCMRALNLGYSIKHAPSAIVIHNCSKIQRTTTGTFHLDRRRLYYMNRNSIIILFLRFPLLTAFERVFRICTSRLLFSIYRVCFFTVLHGIFSGFIVSIKNWRKRSIVLTSVQKLYGNGRYIASFFSDGSYGFRRPTWM